MTNPVWTLALAVGKLKKYICLGSGVFLLIFPISYIALKLDCPPYYVMVIMIAVRSVYLLVVLKIIMEYITFTFVEYLKKVLYPIIKVLLLSLPFVYLVHTRISAGMLLLLVLEVGCVLLFTFVVGLDRDERSTVISMLKSFLGWGKKIIK